MNVRWGSILCLVIVGWLPITTVFCQSTDAPAEGKQQRADVVGEPSHTNGVTAGFIVPEPDVDDVDKFTRGTIEYLVVNKQVPFKHASMLCVGEYSADLARLDNTSAVFMAQALSETNVNYDTIWLSGFRMNESLPWKWGKAGENNETSEINEAFLEEYLVKNATMLDATDRLCLGFGRSYHQEPQFRPLACNAARAFLCQRPRGGPSNKNSTHPGWIKIQDRLYKIFSEMVDYETAQMRCTDFDNRSSLAVVASTPDAFKLARYLLIGRPSLENAWIGARWFNNTQVYTFEAEPIVLAESTNTSTKYPPWRNDEMKYPSGCILLDRHLNQTVYFVEARCQRLRGYICYKMDTNTTVESSDIIIGNQGYRLIYTPKNWKDAVFFCNTTYKAYGGKLVEASHDTDKANLLYVMGQNKSAVQHIWVGGEFTDREDPEHRDANKWNWQWISNHTNINNLLELSMVENTTYTDDVEAGNLCLDMDRENHIIGFYYGTACSYEQSFVCQFTKENLIQLEQDELGGKIA